MGSTGATSPTGAVIALSHGGGPLPVLNDPNHASITHSLRTRVPSILKLGTPDQPRAIVVVTAHWSEQIPTVSSGRSHALLYDYYGFPPESYTLKYDAPGSPEVAAEVRDALKEGGFKVGMDEQRGWDHGVFVPLLLIHPPATIPVIQLSVLSSESPAAHFAMGAALSRLRASNIAIIGSGFASLHNLRAMFDGRVSDPAFQARNRQWSDALTRALGQTDKEERREALDRWRDFPNANEMHPRGAAEHFMPLLVCAGAAREGEEVAMYSDKFTGVEVWSYYWA